MDDAQDNSRRVQVSQRAVAPHVPAAAAPLLNAAMPPWTHLWNRQGSTQPVQRQQPRPRGWGQEQARQRQCNALLDIHEDNVIGQRLRPRP